MRTFLNRFGSDQQGTAVVELAVAAPILAILIMGVTDAGNAFSRKLELEQAAQRAIEKQMQTTGDDTPEGTIKSEAAAQAGVDVSNVAVEYTRLCDGVAKTTYTELCGTTQVTSLYFSVTVTDSYRPMFSGLSLGTKQSDGTYLIRAKAGMRTQ